MRDRRPNHGPNDSANSNRFALLPKHLILESNVLVVLGVAWAPIMDSRKPRHLAIEFRDAPLISAGSSSLPLSAVMGLWDECKHSIRHHANFPAITRAK